MAWNETALEAIAKYRLNPLRAARMLAHLHAGMHDAAVQCNHRRTDVRCMRIAQHLAAGRILEHFFPEETPGRFVSIAVSNLAAMDWSESSPADQASTAFGKTAAWAAILRSLDDGADRTLNTAVRPPPRPGTWRPSPPLFALNPTEQGAPKWKTWLLRAGDEILPPPPLAYGADAYVAEMREV